MVLFAAKKLNIPKSFVEEMKGIAEGSALSYDDVLIANTLFDLKKVMQCTTVTAKGKDCLFARNLDFPSFGVLHKHTIVVSLLSPNGSRISMVTFPGFVGALSGSNSHGLSCGVMEVYGKGYNAQHVPYAMVFRRLLESCKTLKDAEEFMKHNPTTTGNNLMVCDANGDAGVFEIQPSGCFLRTNSKRYIYATNHFLSEKPSGRRILLIEKLLKGKPSPSFDIAKRLLKVTAIVGDNIQSIVTYPKTRTMFLSAGNLPASDGPYIPLGAPLLGFGVLTGNKRALLIGETGLLNTVLEKRCGFKTNTIRKLESEVVFSRILKNAFSTKLKPEDLLLIVIGCHDKPAANLIKTLNEQLKDIPCLKIVLVDQTSPWITAESLKPFSDCTFIVTHKESDSNIFTTLSKTLTKSDKVDVDRDGVLSLIEALTAATDHLKRDKKLFGEKEILKTVDLLRLN